MSAPAPAAHTPAVIELGDQSAPRPAHSPLGASSAERWMECPGSVALIRELALPETDEPSYRAEGTAMHEAAEDCLRSGLETWELVGRKPVVNGTEVEITPEMADAIGIYVDLCRADMAAAAMHYIEFGISSDIHPDFYGTLDFAAIYGEPPLDWKARGWKAPFILPELIKVRDLKGGEGIVVDPYENPQLKYYAYGLIEAHPYWPDETPVWIEIVQPRAFSQDGHHRTWQTTVGEIREWVKSELLPAMHRTAFDNALDAGKWCRFCPAKLVCPLLTSLFRAAATCNPQEVIGYDDATVARSYQSVPAVKHYLKALEDDIYRRLNTGVTMEGMAKLVNKKSNRVYNADANPAKVFGDDALNPPVVKSPAELEKLNPQAREWVKEHCHQPATGLTVALWDDERIGVKVTTSTEAFGNAVAAITGGTNGSSD